MPPEGICPVVQGTHSWTHALWCLLICWAQQVCKARGVLHVPRAKLYSTGLTCWDRLLSKIPMALTGSRGLQWLDT